ncbi:MAG: monofunctional biosynthetic peptidoglycan transglycosylase [Phyllobacteriaceae bacterium]|nr:monofunctional biosynthetic peptidoglycan transglycosylase [Phyllobacteriaceae bacterium]
MRLPLPSRRAFVALVAVVLGLAVLLPAAVLVAHDFGHPPTPLMLWRQARGLPVTRIWTPLAGFDRNLVVAVVASEDNGFCGHDGVDWGELEDVMDQEGGPKRGGSTITMQVTKNLLLWNGFGWLRKPFEIPLALVVDYVWPKEKILETYLNIAEWGPNGEFGAEAGARRAFGKSAARLSPHEAALLTVMLPNPHTRDARRPSRRLAHVADIVRRRAAKSPELADCIPRFRR